MSKTSEKVHEPLFHIVKRIEIPTWKSWTVRIVSVLFALIVCGVLT